MPLPSMPSWCLRPELPVPGLVDEIAFTPSEWKSVWRVVTRKPLPQIPPSLSEMLRLVTQLGGYNNRKSEPPPGPQPIWIGLRRMGDFALAWECFAQQT